MAREYHVCKLPTHRDLFGGYERVLQITANESAVKDLLVCLRHVCSHGKREPLSNFDQDVLCDFYNSLSIFNFK